MTTNTATARYEGLGRDGTGQITSKSGVLDATRYGYGTRFGDEKGTNPEELIAASHAACFTMALSFALAGEGLTEGTLETKAVVTLVQEGSTFTVTKSALTLTASVPGIDADKFAEVAAGAKANCPISKLLNCEVTLEHTLD